MGPSAGGGPEAGGLQLDTIGQWCWSQQLPSSVASSGPRQTMNFVIFLIERSYTFKKIVDKSVFTYREICYTNAAGLRLYLKQWNPHDRMWMYWYRKNMMSSQFMMTHCWLSDTRSQFSSIDLGALDVVGLLSACYYNPHFTYKS